MTDHRDTPDAASAPDDHYQPWLRNRPAAPSPAEEGVSRPPPLPTRQTAPDAPPPPAPRLHDISADELLARPVFLPQPAPPAPGIGERLRAALGAFADWTIDLGERADVPAKIARLELGARAHAAGAALMRLTRSGAERGATALRSGAEAAAPKLRAAAEAAKDGIARGAQEAKSGIGSGTQRLGEAARSLKEAVPAGPHADAAPIESQLDRLLAEDSARPAAPPAGDALPLFAHDEPPAPAPTPAPRPVAAEAPTAPPPFVATPAEAVGAIDDRSPLFAAASAAGAAPPPMTERASLRDWARHPASWALGAAFLLAGGFAAGLYWTGPGVDRATTETVIHDYLLNHPQIIPQAMERLQANQAAETIGQLRDKIERPFSGAWAGAADGDVVMTVFTDYACTFCRASVADIDRLLREDRKLKVVFRELPILSPDSDAAARLALVAAKRGRYMPMHVALFEAGHPDADARRQAAIALDVPNDSAAVNDPAIGREIEDNLALARQLRVDGTPTWVIGDRVLTGAVGYDQLRAAIAAARTK